jgi:hypothetical protein
MYCMAATSCQEHSSRISKQARFDQSSREHMKCTNTQTPQTASLGDAPFVDHQHRAAHEYASKTFVWSQYRHSLLPILLSYWLTKYAKEEAVSSSSFVSMKLLSVLSSVWLQSSFVLHILISRYCEAGVSCENIRFRSSLVTAYNGDPTLDT